MDDQDKFLRELFGDLTNELTPEERDRRKRILKEQVLKVLSTLTQWEKWVLRRRFGIGEDEGTSTKENVSRDFEISRERVRQIEAKALKKLRHPSRSRMLRSFLEEEERGQP